MKLCKRTIQHLLVEPQKLSNYKAVLENRTVEARF